MGWCSIFRRKNRGRDMGCPWRGMVFLMLCCCVVVGSTADGGVLLPTTSKGKESSNHDNLTPSTFSVSGSGQSDHHDTVHNNIKETHHVNETEGKHHGGEGHERFQVASFSWSRVETPMIISLTILIATLAKLVFHFRNKLSAILPESCILIVVGVIIGIILFYSGFVQDQFFHLESELFFFYLLPPIILDAGYFMPTRAFFDNIGTILLYAIIGTLLNTFLVGFSLWGFSLSGGIGAIRLELDILEILTFAALLSAVDPVAVLAVFEEVHVNEVLYIIVFGESLLNDGVTVVLYHMFEGFTEIGAERLLAVDIGAGVGSFFVVAGCGTAVGVVFGFLAALMTRVSDHVPVIQPLIVLVMGYLSYVFAEMFHLSGILACTFCGITMRKYVEANMSRKSHTTTKYFLKLLASVSETIVFLYIGISTVTNLHQWDWGFCILTLLFCLVIRSAVVLGLTSIVNTHRLPKLGRVDQFIMSYGGLRGAIAFSLVIVLDEEVFESKNLFITTTVFVVYFTNFILGATIKPLVNALRVPKADKHKPSLNEQIQNRFIDHLMAGIEDISGHHGHHQLRQKFEYFDKNYLQRIFVRKDALMSRGWSIIDVYEKLNERDAQEMLKGNKDYSGIFSKMKDNPEAMRNMSFLGLLSSMSNQHVPNGFANYNNESQSSLEGDTQIQVDLHAMESQDTRKLRDDSKVHHIMEDAMFLPRKRFTSHRRHVLPPECDNLQEQQLHHKARLHLRHLMSHHGNGHSCNGTNGNGSQNGHNGKPKKNVSFAEVTQVTNTEADTDMGSTKAESGGEDASDGGDTASDIGGITFTVDDNKSTNNPEPETIPTIPVEPAAVEVSLPWKRNTGRDPLPFAVTHSMPDDHHPLLGEAPSWVNNTEYTSPGSPPVTPQVQHPEDELFPARHSTSSQDVNSDRDTDEVNLITLDSPEHKVGILDRNRKVRPDQEDNNHDSIGGGTDNTQLSSQGSSSHNVNSDHALDTQGQAESAIATTIQPWKSADSDNNECSSPLPWRTTNELDEIHLEEKNTDSNGESSSHLPWRSTQSEPHTHKLPWRQVSEESDEKVGTLPWRSNNNEEAESTSTQQQLPWRHGSQDEQRSNTTSDKISGVPSPPWKRKEVAPLPARGLNHVRNQSELPFPHTPYPLPSRSQSEAEMDIGAVSVLPWRDNSHVEVKLDQCAPRPPRPLTPDPPEASESHIPPPPWRHNPEPDSSIRSPSATGTLYSLKPQLSSHSFRISEAESKHSEPMHVPHMIDIPHGRPMFDLDYPDSGDALDLDQDETDLHERVMKWLLACDPEPLPEDDLITLDLAQPGNNNNNSEGRRTPSPTSSASVPVINGNISMETVKAIPPPPRPHKDLTAETRL